MFDETAELLDAYQATLAILPILRQAVVGATAPSPPGQWSALQIICHLADAEERALNRVDLMLRQSQPLLTAYDPAVLARERRYETAALADAEGRFRHLRLQHAALLTSLSNSAWFRTGLHEEVGVISIKQLTTHMVVHDLIHMAQLARRADGQTTC